MNFKIEGNTHCSFLGDYKSTIETWNKYKKWFGGPMFLEAYFYNKNGIRINKILRVFDKRNHK